MPNTTAIENESNRSHDTLVMEVLRLTEEVEMLKEQRRILQRELLKRHRCCEEMGK